MSNIIVCNVGIHLNTEGLYCLNDLHRASGNDNKHRPSLWAENQQTKELIAEIAKAGIPALSLVKGGTSPGTYACKELVYAYAMWISPAFHLHVIRAFDAMICGQKSIHKTKTPTEIILDAAKIVPPLVRAARALGLDKNAAALSANQAVHKLTGQNVLALLGHTHLEAEQQVLFFTPTELGAQMGISGRKFNLLLAEAGLQAKQGDVWVPLPPAESFYRVMDTGKRHANGTMVQQIKWAENVLELVREAA